MSSVDPRVRQLERENRALRREVASLRTFRQVACAQSLNELHRWAVRQGMSVANASAPIGAADGCSTIPDGGERRSWARAPVRAAVRFILCDQPGGSTVGRLGNLGPGGISIISDTIPQGGAKLVFGFYVNHRGRRHLVRALARVVWAQRDSRPGHSSFGVHLLSPPAGIVALLREIVRDTMLADAPPLPARRTRGLAGRLADQAASAGRTPRRKRRRTTLPGWNLEIDTIPRFPIPQPLI